MKVAFDVDGTLFDAFDRPRYDVINLFMLLEKFGCEMFVWSGGGESYAKSKVRYLGLNAKIVSKGSFKPDLAVDDMKVALGVSNLCVGEEGDTFGL